jgi:hypothetical protein
LNSFPKENLFFFIYSVTPKSMVNYEASEEVFYQFTKSNREKRKWKSLNNWVDPHKGAQPALTLHTWAHLSVTR